MAAADRLNVAAPIKLLYILDEFPDPHAGTESQFWLLLHGLDRRQVEPTILLLRPSAFLREHAGSVPLRVLNVPRLRSLTGMVRIVRAALWAKRSGFQVAHIFFNDSTLAFPMVLSLMRIKVIVSRRDLGFWYTRLNLAVLRLQAKFLDVVVANCEAVRNAVVEAERLPPAKVRVIYNGIAQPPPSSLVDHYSLGVPADAALIVIVANLRPLKRIDNAVHALATLQGRQRPVHLVVVGEDRKGRVGPSHRAELEQLAMQLGVSERMHFAGKMSDPSLVIARADVCVLCSDTEGLSNVIIEYMFSGKPVVCTDVGGNPELVLSAKTGEVVPADDAAALGRAIGSLLDDPARAATYGLAGRDRACQLFTASVMIEHHTTLYCDLAVSSRSKRSR